MTIRCVTVEEKTEGEKHRGWHQKDAGRSCNSVPGNTCQKVRLWGRRQYTLETSRSPPGAKHNNTETGEASQDRSGNQRPRPFHFTFSECRSLGRRPFFVARFLGSAPCESPFLSASLATRPAWSKGVPSECQLGDSTKLGRRCYCRERQLGGSTKLGLPKGLAEKRRPSAPAHSCAQRAKNTLPYLRELSCQECASQNRIQELQVEQIVVLFVSPTANGHIRATSGLLRLQLPRNRFV